jgi:hypothetical protein
MDQCEETAKETEKKWSDEQKLRECLKKEAEGWVRS